MVGEHDEPVGPRRVGGRRRDAGDLAVHLAQHRQRVGPLDPGMVSDLVIGEEGRVDGRPPGQHVADDGRDLQVELHDRRPGAGEGVAARAVDARLHVVAPLPQRRVALPGDLGQGEDEGARRRVGTREVGRVVAADRPPPVQHGAHRQHRMDRVAGEDVGAAGSVGVQQAAAVRVAALELLRVTRMIGDDRGAAVLLPPAEGGHVVIVSVQKAGLAGAGLRGPVGLPALQAVFAGAHPAGEVRGVAVPERAVQHVMRQPVDLEEDDPRHVRLDAVAAPPRLPGDDVAVPGVVLVDRQQRVEESGEGGEAEGDHDPLRHPVEVGAGDLVHRDGDENPVQDQRSPSESQHGQR